VPKARLSGAFLFLCLLRSLPQPAETGRPWTVRLETVLPGGGHRDILAGPELNDGTRIR